MPGFKKELHFLIRNSKNKKIMASLMGVPKRLVVSGKTIKVCEVNFLAVHKKLRSKRLAQVVIAEMMRRKRKLGFMQAFYTSGHTMPTPFTTVMYMNRFINCYKLIDCLYTHLPGNKTISEFAKQHRLPPKHTVQIIGNVRAMEKKDLSTVYKLFMEQMAKYKMYFKYSQDDLKHLLLPKDDVIWTWVIETEEEGKG